MKISVIIPVYNEEDVITSCLNSLGKQTLLPDEVIVVDDGSSDKTFEVLSEYQISNIKYQIFKKDHKGPGVARNFGAKHANGDILVFVDSDMTFDEKFLEKLTEPIRNRKVKGTFNKDEFVANWDNSWARCWNYNQNLSDKRRIPKDYPNEAPVFRAILKKEFNKAKGFDLIGYTDDWTLSRKLGFKSKVAKDAVSYHDNPETLLEIFKQARWVGKNEFITGTFLRKLISLIRFSFPASIIIGVIKSIKFFDFRFVIFKIVYDFAIIISIIGSFFGEAKSK